jgi:nucleotide-binding universal stress UspA family protein
MDTRNRFESPASGLAGEAWTEAERERAERAVAQAADILSGVATTTAVAEGIPHEEILARAGEVDAVVMGTHGRTGLDHYLIGSVAERVVRRSPTPVMTVRIDGAGE